MRRLILLLVLVLLAVAGCGGGEGERPQQQGQTSAAPAADEFQNPLYEQGSPGRFLLLVDGTYYAYATNSDDENVPTLTSKDLVRWEPAGDAMPKLAPWVLAGKTWAPEIAKIGNTYHLYYTAGSLDVMKQCVGHAVARKPTGPYADMSKKPLVCQVNEGGSIDAHPFRDADGTLYLLWKNDGNCCGMDTFIYSQKLSKDGSKLVGKRIRLVKQDSAWEGMLVEAPSLLEQEGTYYLFFSGNAYNTDAYAVGYATCETPLGPCEDAPENPILATECDAGGPGHQTFITDDDGELWIVYHAWEGGPDLAPGRSMWIDEVVWKDGKPDVLGPTCEPQPRP